ncbi:MAG: MFS transporter [Bryobacteraceae bacterium]
MKRAWGLIALLAATATASYLCRVNVSVAGALMMRELGLSQAEMGKVFSAFLLGYALCQIPAGMLADRFGPRRVLMLSVLAAVLTTISITIAGTLLLALLFVRFLLGVAESPTFPAAAQAIARWLPANQRGRSNGIVIAAIGLGSAIAPPLVSAVMVRAGWRWSLLVSAVPALLAGIGWLVVRVPDDGPKAGGVRGAIPMSRGFALLALSYTLQGYVGYIFVFWFYLYLVDVRHFDLLRGAVLSSMPWLLSILSIPLGGWLFDRLGTARRSVPIMGLAGAGLMTALGAHTKDAYVAAACLALATALVLSVEGPFWATMTEFAGPHSGAAGGAMNMGSNVGGLISPALTPVIAASLGWESALLVSAGLAMIGAILWIWINPPATA